MAARKRQHRTAAAAAAVRRERTLCAIRIISTSCSLTDPACAATRNFAYRYARRSTRLAPLEAVEVIGNILVRVILRGIAELGAGARNVIDVRCRIPLTLWRLMRSSRRGMSRMSPNATSASCNIANEPVVAMAVKLTGRWPRGRGGSLRRRRRSSRQ